MVLVSGFQSGEPSAARGEKWKSNFAAPGGRSK
jgi:hypothetical protein